MNVLKNFYRKIKPEKSYLEGGESISTLLNHSFLSRRFSTTYEKDLILTLNLWLKFEKFLRVYDSQYTVCWGRGPFDYENDMITFMITVKHPVKASHTFPALMPMCYIVPILFKETV